MGWGALFLAILAAQVAPAEVRAPAGDWAVTPGPGECVLSRSFGAGKRSTTVSLQRMPGSPGGGMSLTVPGAELETKAGRGRIVVLPSGKKFAARWSTAPRPGAPGTTTGVEAPADFWTALPRATGLILQGMEDRPIDLPVGSMTNSLAAYEACNARLLRGWGADPAATIAPGPWLSDWYTRNDYPEAAARRGAQGRAIALAAVDPSGRTSSCKVVLSSGDPDLDHQTCAMTMGKARAPRASKGYNTMRWLVVPVNWALPAG